MHLSEGFTASAAWSAPNKLQRTSDLSATAFWGEEKANALWIYQHPYIAHGIQYSAEEGRDGCYLAIHHFRQCPMANALFFFPSDNARVLLYSEELLPSPPPQMVMKPWKCSFCRMKNKMERVILTWRSGHCLQLLVSAGHVRSQAMQLGHGQHNRITAEMRKPGQTCPCRLPGTCWKHADVSTDAPGFFFSPLPHGSFLHYRHGSADLVPVELIHPFDSGRVSEMCW